MKSSVAKQSVVLAGYKTSISLEDEFWRALKDIASSRRTTLRDLINSISFDDPSVADEAIVPDFFDPQSSGGRRQRCR